MKQAAFTVDADYRAWPASYWRLSPQGVLAVAAVVNLLLFIRIAVLYAPQFSFQGPNGADKVYYYAYTRSLVIDRDVDFTNEMAMHPPSTPPDVRNGRLTNQYPIGSPALAIPAFAVTHLAILIANAVSAANVSADGYSAPYAMSYALSQMAWALFGMYLLFRAVSTYVPERIAALAVVAAWFGTNALRYTAVDVGMSHSAALFSVAWCSYESVTLGNDADNWKKWFRLGASSAFLILARYQDGVYLLVPATAAALVIARRRETTSVWETVRNLLWGAVGAVLMFLPQLFVWHSLFGTWIANSYGDRVAVASWLRPHVYRALFDPYAGLAIWLPALAVGLIGCVRLAAGRKDLIALAAAVAWLANAYVSAAFPWPSNMLRSPFDMLFPVALGLGWVLARAEQRRALWPRVLIGLLVAWSLPFSAVTGMPISAAGGSFFTGWFQCVLTLLHVS